MDLTINAENEQQTMEIGEKLGEIVKANQVITLNGGLGAGKTTFTKGLAKGLEIKRTVNSPTYTIVKEYKGRLPLFHMDVYRLGEDEEDIGFDEYFSNNGVSVIEWAENIKAFLPSDRLDIYIEKINDQQRQIYFSAEGQAYEKLIEELQP